MLQQFSVHCIIPYVFFFHSFDVSSIHLYSSQWLKSIKTTERQDCPNSWLITSNYGRLHLKKPLKWTVRVENEKNKNVSAAGFNMLPQAKIAMFNFAAVGRLAS